MKTNQYNYRQMKIPASQLVIPRETYQRPFTSNRAKEIAANFDERIANEPKVSYRDGKYFVFDGQHTVAARVMLNGGNDLLITCKVYYGMTEKEEAVFKQMQERQFRVTTGDEFISSLIANEMQERITPANDFVFRFWTGTYRSISENYKTTLICLHVPAEKGTGMISLFDRYICKGRIPPREKAWKMLHISCRSVKVAIITMVKKILKRQ